MGGRGALSTTGRRVGAAASSVLSKNIAGKIGFNKDTVGRLSYKGSNIFSTGEGSINYFAKRVSEEYGKKKNGKLVERNRGLEYAVKDAATEQYSAMKNLTNASDTINRLINNKGKSEPKYYINKAQTNLNNAKTTAKMAQKLLSDSSIPDAVKIQINPTASNSFKKNVNSVQSNINKQINKYYGK